MRVITGLARGKRLITVPGNDLVRPTSEKVKESIFSSIQFDIEGRRILDLFAGSGQMGIEALSRGAESAVFVDSSDVSLGVVRQNLSGTVFEDKAKIVKSDYKTFLSRENVFDIAFLDPPYNKGILKEALPLVCKVMSDYGIIICEHESEEIMPKAVGDFAIYREYKFGKIKVTVYKKGEMAND
ncbi:MAG: 16S rRNA (guanine(966)-N(2))-methyltransferase RsmD [Clostridia bacterium]|nr:16S rRNA (guanine(966)-N(2))-methyltransferase RsmD [Clostridia bacterium]